MKDSQNMGLVETTIRWWQVRVRTLRYNFERRFGFHLTPDSVIWPWLARHSSFLMEKVCVRGDGHTAHFAAFGCGYRGELMIFGEICLFKIPMSHSRAISANTRAHKGESTFTKGMWVGTHDRSDDHLLLTRAV